MERIKNITILAALLLASAGCAKQESGTQGPASLMSIEPEVENMTKATPLIDDASGLQAQGFGVSIYTDGTAYKGPVEMEYKNGAWAPKNGTMDWKWPSNTVYTFYAWSPADLAVGSVTSTGVPAFTYSGIADQKDIMLGSYTGPGVPGSGNVCAAPVRFSHALASVQFKTGTMTGLGNITKIELSGVATSGTCTPSYSGSSTVGFAWSSIGSSTTTLTQDGFSPASSATAGNGIGDPFLVLPQSGELTVSLTDSNGSIVTATISAPVLTVGHTTVYAVNFDGRTVSFTVSIEGWGTVTDGGTVTVDE